MATYNQVSDKRNTSNGITPDKAKRQPPVPQVKKPLGASSKQAMRRPQGR